MTPEAALFKSTSGSVFRIEASLFHGSGFLLDTAGMIATNDHVLGNAEKIYVYVDSVTRVEAITVARDPNRDLALIRVAPFVVIGHRPLVLSPEASDALVPGDRVLALGFPMNQPLTMTGGMVANVRQTAVMTDMSIKPGNSGGPIIDLDGKVVAVVAFREVDRPTQEIGLAGGIRASQLVPLLSAARGTLTSIPSARHLPSMPTAVYPVAELTSAADTLDPGLFIAFQSMTSGPFGIDISTPLSHMLATVTLNRSIAKDRRKREQKASIPDELRYVNDDERRDWTSYVGDETEPVVAIKVSPLFGETGGSSSRRSFEIAMVGVSDQATIRFQGDVRSVTLRRNGEAVEPLGGGHSPIPRSEITAEYEFTDVADLGYYLYPPEAFRPVGRQQPPEMVLEIEDLKHLGSTRREKLPPVLVARIWNDFEGYFRHNPSSTPFTPYIIRQSCAVTSATAMGGVSNGTLPPEPAACTYFLLNP